MYVQESILVTLEVSYSLLLLCDTLVTIGLTGEGDGDTVPPSKQTLIDALYTTTVVKNSNKDKVIKKPKTDPFIQDGKDLRKLRRTAKVLSYFSKYLY